MQLAYVHTSTPLDTEKRAVKSRRRCAMPWYGIHPLVPLEQLAMQQGYLSIIHQLPSG